VPQRVHRIVQYSEPDRPAMMRWIESRTSLRGHCDNTGVEGNGIGWISKSSRG
jgi:hypothetical protein